MSNDFIKKNYHLITFFICYLTLLIGFFLGENITTGPKRDFLHTWDGAMEFNDDFNLYKLIAKIVVSAVPVKQLEKKIFHEFVIKKEEIPKNTRVYYY